MHQASAHKPSPWLALGSSLCHFVVTWPGHSLLPPPANTVAPLNLSEPRPKAHAHTHTQTYTRTHRMLVYSSEKIEWQRETHFHQDSTSCLPAFSHHLSDTAAADSKMLDAILDSSFPAASLMSFFPTWEASFFRNTACSDSTGETLWALMALVKTGFCYPGVMAWHHDANSQRCLQSCLQGGPRDKDVFCLLSQPGSPSHLQPFGKYLAQALLLLGAFRGGSKPHSASVWLLYLCKVWEGFKASAAVKRTSRCQFQLYW